MFDVPLGKVLRAKRRRPRWGPNPFKKRRLREKGFDSVTLINSPSGTQQWSTLSRDFRYVYMGPTAGYEEDGAVPLPTLLPFEGMEEKERMLKRLRAVFQMKVKREDTAKKDRAAKRAQRKVEAEAERAQRMVEAEAKRAQRKVEAEAKRAQRNEKQRELLELRERRKKEREIAPRSRKAARSKRERDNLKERLSTASGEELDRLKQIKAHRAEQTKLRMRKFVERKKMRVAAQNEQK